MKNLDSFKNQKVRVLDKKTCINVTGGDWVWCCIVRDWVWDD